MPFRAYKMDAGIMRAGWAPDGMHLALGATMLNGRDLAPIEAIDWDGRLYRREGGEWMEIPANHYADRDIVWEEPGAVGEGE